MSDIGNLILTRNKDQSIIINGMIEVTILDIQGNKVRLGVRAPRSVSVYRSEIHDEIQRERRERGE